MAGQFGTQAFESYEALLAAPDLDAVVIGSENVRHRELTEMAASAGKHVLCEKPLATTVADGEAMIAACKSAGVQLMTAFPVPLLARDAAHESRAGSRGTRARSSRFAARTGAAIRAGGLLTNHCRAAGRQ